MYSLSPIKKPKSDISKIIIPIMRLISHILLTLKCDRTAFTKNVTTNHHNIAPANIDAKPTM